MAGIVVPVDGDISPLLAEVQKLPGRTQQEMDAVGRVIDQEITRGRVAKAFAELPGVSQKQARKAANMLAREIDKGAKDAERSLKDVDKAFKVLGSSALDDLDDLATGLSALGPAGMAVGVALTGAAAASTALIAGGALVSFLYDAADASGELEGEQRALDEALGDVQKKVGEKVAPVFEELDVVAVAGTLALSDLTDEVWGFIETGAQWYEQGGALVQGIDAASGGFLRAASTLVRLNDETDDGVRAQGDYIAQARLLVGEADKKIAKENEEKEARKATTQAIRDQRTELEREIEALQARDFWMEKAIALDEREAEALAALDQQIAENSKGIAAAQKEQVSAVAEVQAGWSSVGNASVDALAAIGEMVAGVAEEGSVAAGVAIAIQKAAAISSVAISTAQAVMQALATVPPPAGPILAGAYVATGVAQAALIAAQPETFHTGGIKGWSPDETMARVRPGEGVLTAQGVQAVGGAAGVAAANRGEGGGGVMRVEMRYEHKLLSDVLGDNLRMRSSPLSRAVKGDRRAGIRRRDG